MQDHTFVSGQGGYCARCGDGHDAHPESTPREINMNGCEIIMRTAEVMFVRLPKEIQRSAGTCNCDYCKGAEGFWDTLAVPLVKSRKRVDTCYTVHMPDAKGQFSRASAETREKYSMQV